MEPMPGILYEQAITAREWCEQAREDTIKSLLAAGACEDKVKSLVVYSAEEARMSQMIDTHHHLVAEQAEQD